MKVGEYYYRISGDMYRIYRCDYNHNGTQTGEPVYGEPVYRDAEEARKRVYELNGWAYKGPQKDA